jgi:hypothetical protein
MIVHVSGVDAFWNVLERKDSIPTPIRPWRRSVYARTAGLNPKSRVPSLRASAWPMLTSCHPNDASVEARRCSLDPTGVSRASEFGPMM